MEFTIRPIAKVSNSRSEIQDDYWAEIVSEIELEDNIPAESLDGIDTFSHLEIIYIFHKAVGLEPVLGSEHPRENKRWPKVGIFAQRKKNRPNHIGSTIVELLRRDGKKLLVKYLDAIDGTPVVDIKPVMREFLPMSGISQPDWSKELMINYWE
ncbi:tRNA (N6-threonylcarbamoyladenosine(37)-N6)-methyltransferase TrmO [Leptospira hartskeerlii]|uniref:tRNA (N6-threonylcarbamoyladenosine(37)-N6)-methyltransferase TrmO n=1 Tax=Leptospira hartskeerlii TaxID=2023177 RepID=A0A2M9XDV4_9LEPT|nr:SAM-dependent methyltransferase [Leptospira hartskeerlii]PJZ25866.1 tRNA (N6-threonylcarbamoyladenosine(37)-N6)-methyltransferase TrmO [Leptospira hartskeerlii]PJZ35311.1 tRNA (N6-threonylcarbamoyladenosine(37)-N6)-methyltransferase TrmO [Leptospira hartskeerlii]